MGYSSHRRQLFDLQDGCCAECMQPGVYDFNATEGLLLTLHHLLPKPHPLRGKIENKVLLCLNCHKLWHNNHPDFNSKEFLDAATTQEPIVI